MSGSDSIVIRRGTQADIRSLRHRILMAGFPIEAADFEHDNDPTTFHATAIMPNGVVIGCATIMLSEFDDQPAWRLRGMAVDPAFRRLHLGARLLDLCETYGREAGLIRFWCNARTPAVPFYLSQGWTRLGDEYDIPSIGPHYRMRKYLQEI